MWKSLFATVLLGCAVPAFAVPADDADDYSALQAKDPASSIQQLYAICSSADKSVNLYCTGYITAMVESMTAVGKEPLASEYGICPRGPVSAAAGVQAFKNWAQTHRKEGGLTRYIGVAWALQESWPCS
jgi:hypothetical protein